MVHCFPTGPLFAALMVMAIGSSAAREVAPPSNLIGTPPVHEGAPGTSWKDGKTVPKAVEPNWRPTTAIPGEGTPGKFWEDGKAIAKASTPAPHPAAAGDGAPGKSWEDNKIVAKAPTSGSHPTAREGHPRKILGRRSPHVRRSATSEPPLMMLVDINFASWLTFICFADTKPSLDTKFTFQFLYIDFMISWAKLTPLESTCLHHFNQHRSTKRYQP
ncbi:hypothetical protein Pst134EB_010743 [Puccinia striiformis f. sp. tritici]|nr:hypothetical protein Pst134EB_010743 [Puccinia striiformis f. sp. tritici]